MRDKKLLALLGSVCLMLVLGALPFMAASTKAAPGSVKPIELNFAICTPGTHFQATRQHYPWLSDIKRATEGRVKITLYPAGTLLDATEIYGGIIKGATDIGTPIFSYTPGRFPVFEVFELPGICYNNATVVGHVLQYAYKELKPAEVAAVKILFLYANGPASLFTKTPVRSLEDIRGMEIRSTGLGIKALTALGATPVPMPIAEVYGALQKGIVNGVLMPTDGLKAWRFGELVKYTTIVPCMTTTVFAVAMNLDKWQALPADIKKVFEEVSEVWAERSGSVADDENKKGLDWAIETQRHQVIELPPEELAKWVALLKGEQDKYVSTMAAKGLPGKEALDLVLRLAEKYNKRYPALK